MIKEKIKNIVEKTVNFFCSPNEEHSKIIVSNLGILLIIIYLLNKKMIIEDIGENNEYIYLLAGIVYVLTSFYFGLKKIKIVKVGLFVIINLILLFNSIILINLTINQLVSFNSLRRLLMTIVYLFLTVIYPVYFFYANKIRKFYLKFIFFIFFFSSIWIYIYALTI